MSTDLVSRRRPRLCACRGATRRLKLALHGIRSLKVGQLQRMLGLSEEYTRGKQPITEVIY